MEHVRFVLGWSISAALLLAGCGGGSGQSGDFDAGASLQDGGPPDTDSGTDSDASPSPFPLPITAMVVGGANHSCAVLDDGRVRCWGDPFEGALGYGLDTLFLTFVLPSQNGDVDLGGTAAQVAAGDRHTCVLYIDGRVRCWGAGFNGRLGYGNENRLGLDETPAMIPDVPVGGRVTQIVAAGSHTCALLEGGSVRCWGEGLQGALGHPPPDGEIDRVDIGDDETPASVGDIDIGGTVVQIATGTDHSCAVLNNGKARCWGLDSFGRLGYPQHFDEFEFTNKTAAELGDLSLGANAISIHAGGRHTCAVLEGGSVRCWGDNTFAQLGSGLGPDSIGDTEHPSSIATLSLSAPADDLALGRLHSCALLDTGAVQCWGTNLFAQLGYGNTDPIEETDVPSDLGVVSLGGTATFLGTGEDHSCAILSDSTLRCWGQNDELQCGYIDLGPVAGDDETPAAMGPVCMEGTESTCPG